MRTEELQLISDVGRALFAAPALAESRSVETLAALSTIERLTEEQTLEKALLALLSRAERDGTSASASGVAQPFYRLSPNERFVLVLLHSGKISYARLARLLGISGRDVEALAWHARVKLASQPEVRLSAPHPRGTSKLKQQCPAYDPAHPWTQRFLDDEMTKAELVQLQNHTVACADCLTALTGAREFYYALESQIPSSTLSTEAIAKTLRQARLRLHTALPADLTGWEAAQIFFRRRETRWALAFFGAVLFYAIFHA